jgi:hypothetical protein
VTHEMHPADLTGPPNSLTENLAPNGTIILRNVFSGVACTDFAERKPQIFRDNSGDRNFSGKTAD